jgi:hypothetical protein
MIPRDSVNAMAVPSLRLFLLTERHFILVPPFIFSCFSADIMPRLRIIYPARDMIIKTQEP